MNYKFHHIILVLLLYICITPSINAQGIDEVMLINQTDYVSSARMLGTGNAMGAIGGDLGTVSINPATIASFRRSYAPTVGIGLNINNTDIADGVSSAFSKSKNSSSGRMFLSNIGFVLNQNYNQSLLRTFNFAVTFNRVSNFNENINFHGRDYGSIAQRWVKLANGNIPENLEPYEALPAYNSYAIDLIDPSDPNADQYFSDYGANDILNKEVKNKISGGQNDLAFSFGANLNEKFMVGMNISMPFFNYTEDRFYTEWDDEMDTTVYERINFSEYITTSGVGFKVGLGMIILPTPKIRLGVNYNSPTWYSLTKNSTSEINYISSLNGSNEPVDGYFSYKYRSPWSIGAQAGFIIGKYGFIDFDMEYRDYGSSKFNYGDDYEVSESQINNYIEKNLGSALSMRVGGELALTNWRLRTGVGFSQLGYDADTDFYPQYHAGFGYRGMDYYFDLGYKTSSREYRYLPYTTGDNNENSIPIGSRNHIIVATFGIGI